MTCDLHRSAGLMHRGTHPLLRLRRQPQLRKHEKKYLMFGRIVPNFCTAGNETAQIFLTEDGHRRHIARFEGHAGSFRKPRIWSGEKHVHASYFQRSGK